MSLLIAAPEMLRVNGKHFVQRQSNTEPNSVNVSKTLTALSASLFLEKKKDDRYI